MPDFARDTRGKRHVPPRVLCSFLHNMQVALATCSMSKTVQKAPGADGLRRLWTWTKQCKKPLEQMAYAACGHGRTVQKAPGVDSKRRLCGHVGARVAPRASAPSKPPAPPPSPHVEGWSTCATWAWAGGSRWLGPLQATCMPAPSPHLEGWSTCATWASLVGKDFIRACSFE